MTDYPHIDALEAPLREAHRRVAGMTFQAFVDTLRAAPVAELHETAVAYNRAVYEMQRQFYKGGRRRDHNQQD